MQEPQKLIDVFSAFPSVTQTLTFQNLIIVLFLLMKRTKYHRQSKVCIILLILNLFNIFNLGTFDHLFNLQEVNVRYP